MERIDELRSVWQSAPVDALPDSAAMLRVVQGFRDRKLRKKWLVITAAFCLSGLFTVVLLTVDFRLMTTYIGGGLVVLSGLLLAGSNIRSMRRFYRLESGSNKDFVAFLEQTRLNQIRYYRRTMVLLLSLCSAGWGLYMYEALRAAPLWAFLIYTGFVLYLALMWFYVRPRAMARDAEHLRQTRLQTENLKQQLETNEN